MQVFKNQWFVEFARKEHITDAKLCEAIRDAERGLIDANYGGSVIKQRIARPNEGKSGGYRAIILFRQGDKSFFVYGFPKSKRQNISEAEKRAFKEFAKTTFDLTEDQLSHLIETEVYVRIPCDV